ncbi:MAG: EAL domain-containing protein [Burkholderiaceae bacterium]
MSDTASKSSRSSVDKFLVQNARVLMIDDEPILIELVRAFLEDAGYETFEGISEPKTALLSIRDQRPDVILLDLMMPEVSGFDILEQVRGDDALRSIPVIVMTSASDADTKLRVLELGAADFLEKPVDPSELVLRLRNTLAFKAQNDRMTWFDPLTNLPNRKLFLNQLRSAVRRAVESNQVCALLNINIDRFNKINETLGHRAGDELLRQAAQRLQNALFDSGTQVPIGDRRRPWSLSRIGGDEFAALMSGLEDTVEPTYAARRMLEAMSKPMQLDGQEIFISATIGVAACPIDSAEPERLLQQANAALSAAKDRGRNQYAFYSNDLDSENRERMVLENDLRKGIPAGEFELHFQPKVEVATNRIIGAEALLRWNHPKHGRVSPATFIPLAEELNLMNELSEIILAQACAQAVRWRENGVHDCTVSVNVSAQQFSDDLLLQQVSSALANAGLEPAMLTLELTESVLMHDTEAALERLLTLSELGVHTSLDDFGTGFSSLAYLRRMRMDELKVDKSFIDPLPDQADSAAIVRAILAMSHSLGMVVTAEGVETPEQLAFLREAGCDIIQGYLFSKPLPADTFLKLLLKQRTAEANKRALATRGVPRHAGAAEGQYTSERSPATANPPDDPVTAAPVPATAARVAQAE